MLPFLKNITFQNVYLSFEITFSRSTRGDHELIVSETTPKTEVLQKLDYNRDHKIQNYFKKEASMKNIELLWFNIGSRSIAVKFVLTTSGAELD